MEQLGFHWTNVHEICYLSIFLISVEKIQISLNLRRVVGTLHENIHTYNNNKNNNNNNNNNLLTACFKAASVRQLFLLSLSALAGTIT